MRDRARGALLGMATGDALGTTLEFKPPGSFTPIEDMVGGGPFKLKPGEWTDDTSMGLCLAESLIERRQCDAVDQLERYVRWWRHGHLSSTGTCFDIGVQTSSALAQFERTHSPNPGSPDPEKAANGSIMRLAAVPIAYAPDIAAAIEQSGRSSMTTHPAQRPVDACRYLGALIASAVCGVPKDELLAARFWRWDELHREIAEIAAGSFKRKHPPEIKGTGYVVRSLEAALWALHNSGSFRDGALMAVNLGDDADTTGAVYGQIAGAIYGEDGIPREWRAKLALHDQIVTFADGLCALGAVKPPPKDSYWVAPRLLAGKYPGARIESEAKSKVAALIDAGIRMFVDLTVAGELLPYEHLLPAGVQHHRVPVPDVTAPTNKQVREALNLIDAGRAMGGVYVHCWGGCGRTGVLIGCYLREQGSNPDAALARVHELTRAVQSKPCPETPRQVKTVTEWTPRDRSGGTATLLPSSVKAQDELAAEAGPGIGRLFSLRRAAGDVLEATVRVMGFKDEEDLVSSSTRGFTLADVLHASGDAPEAGRCSGPAGVEWLVYAISNRLWDDERPVGFQAKSLLGHTVDRGVASGEPTPWIEVHHLIWTGPLVVNGGLINDGLNEEAGEAHEAYWDLVFEIERLANEAVPRVHGLERFGGGFPTPRQRVWFRLQPAVDRGAAFNIAAGLLLREKPQGTAIRSLRMYPSGEGWSDDPAIATLMWELQYDLDAAQGRDWDWGYRVNADLAATLRSRLEDPKLGPATRERS